MAQITIRQVDDAVVAGLRRRAAVAGHSMEQEARRILAAATVGDAEEVARRLRQRLAAFGGRRFSDSGDLVREMRDARRESS